MPGSSKSWAMMPSGAAMTPDALVIGAGPAGLMAADVLSAAGFRVVLADAKPSPARKFLMAGKTGLNITRDEPIDRFIAQYGDAASWLGPMVRAFGPAQIVDWMHDLGQSAFTGSTGRVFPTSSKASPLLRAWLARLAAQNVDLRTRWVWTGLNGASHRFETPQGAVHITPRVAILALGGASWARLGSDGAWVAALAPHGVRVAPFQPSNIGMRVTWSAPMARWFGAPVKSVALSAGSLRSRGEFVISAQGVEGGGLYPLTPALRQGAPLVIDLFPDLDAQQIAARLAARPSSETVSNTLKKALKLTDARLALVHELARPLPSGAMDRARALKALTLHHDGPRPLDQAISTAGGITRDSLTRDLRLSLDVPIFAAGEMLDWEAPTGGYLLTACLATGRHAGRAATRLLQGDPGQDQPL